MIRTKNISLFTLLAIAGLGCNKSLDLNPLNKISDASYWKTSNDFQLAANDFYFNLLKAPNYTDNNSDIVIGNGDDVAANYNNSGVSNGSLLPQSETDLWNNSYKYIRSTTYLLQKAKESDLKQDVVGRWKGEAFFFRAYNYWNLVKAYGGVPKIDMVLDVTSPELYSPRVSQSDIIDFILSDLDSAIAKLPLQSALTADEQGRVTQGAALALKARAGLYEGTWEKYNNGSNAAKYLDVAVTAANQLIASGEYALYTDKGADSYKYLFITEGNDCKEIILDMRYSVAQQVTHNWTRELLVDASMVPTKAMADMYLATDGLPITQSSLFQGRGQLASEFQNRDSRMTLSFVAPGSKWFAQNGWTTYVGGTPPDASGNGGSLGSRTGYRIRKFSGESSDNINFKCSYGPREFRYAETLLILAEALYEKNGSISDADLNRTINVIRARVNMPALTNAFVTSNGLNMLNEIRRERSVELAFEGFRRDDLRRWNLAAAIMPKAIKGIKYKGTEFENQFGPISNLTIDPTDSCVIVVPASVRQFLPKHMLYPLPLHQVQLSKGTLVQNDGWGN